MHHAPATIEEQLLLKAIKEECPWESLPKRLQATLSSKEEWHRRVIEHCIKKRLQWSSCFARKLCKESEYYEDMMRYLRRNLALFPYHLAEYVCRVMRVSPFRYYCDMIFEVMKNEQPYDSILNFSAADALRLTGGAGGLCIGAEASFIKSLIVRRERPHLAALIFRNIVIEPFLGTTLLLFPVLIPQSKLSSGDIPQSKLSSGDKKDGSSPMAKSLPASCRRGGVRNKNKEKREPKL